MSQNGPHSGPPWSGGGSEEPYTEPADPWGDHGAAEPAWGPPAAAPQPPWGAAGASGVGPDPVWGSPSAPASLSEPSWAGHPTSIPQQPAPYHPAAHSAPTSGGAGPAWGHPPAPQPARRNTPMLALIGTLGLLVCVGLGATLWLLNERNNNQPAGASATATSAAPANPGPAPMGSEDARFYVKKGDCVVNEGTDEEPEMRTTVCTSGTYVVLEQFKGKTTGEKDAEGKCAKVTGYTKWYFYDSPLDDLDFVLCLKEHGSS